MTPFCPKYLQQHTFADGTFKTHQRSISIRHFLFLLLVSVHSYTIFDWETSFEYVYCTCTIYGLLTRYSTSEYGIRTFHFHS
jgi:hypothetical protein